MVTRQNQEMIRVWGLPVRLMHWGMVGAFVTAMWTRNSILNQLVHVYAGYVMAALLVLRILYGVFARDLAAFRTFPLSLPAGALYLLDFLRGRARRYLGHNPAAAVAVYGLLGLGAITVMLGYVAFEYDLEWAKDCHHHVAYAWFWLVCFHVLSVLVVGLAQREFLVKAMITGDKMRAPDLR